MNSAPPSPEDDALDDFHERSCTLDGITKRVHVSGLGPAVIVMAEMPGISPHVARFARWVRNAGFTVYLPSLFGTDGLDPTLTHDGLHLNAAGTARLSSLLQAVAMAATGERVCP